jgi:hypothetical protein
MSATKGIQSIFDYSEFETSDEAVAAFYYWLLVLENDLRGGTFNHSDIMSPAAIAQLKAETLELYAAVGGTDDLRAIVVVNNPAVSGGGPTIPENPLTPAQAKALAVTGINFTTRGYRNPLSKKAGVDALPAGAYITGQSIRFNDGANVTFTGWDLAGYQLYVDRGTVNLIDCYLANAANGCVNVLGTATFTADWCEFDGLKSTTNVQSLATQSADTANSTFRDCHFHSSPNDCITIGSNSRVERGWFEDGGYKSDSHFDYIQTATGAGTRTNIVIIDSFFDGTIKNVVEMNNALRLIGESGSATSGILVEGNVIVSLNTAQPPLALGNRITPSENVGAGAEDYIVRNNFIDYVTAGVVYTPMTPPTGDALWQDNVRLTAGTLIDPPTGWTDEIVVPTEPPATAVPYAMMWDFDSVGTATPSSAVSINIDTSSRHIQGTGGLRVEGNSTNLAQSVNTVLTFTDDMAAWDRIVLYCNAAPVSAYIAAMASVRPRVTIGGTQYNYQVNTAAGEQFNSVFGRAARGGRWLSFPANRLRAANWDGARAVDQGTASKTLTAVINAQNPGNADTDIVLDALIRPANRDYKPCIMVTFDDAGETQRTVAFPLMEERGIKGTCYMCAGLLGQPTQMTLTQARELVTAGWAMANDSDRIDNPLTMLATRAEGIAKLNECRDENATLFPDNDPDAANHLCYSYGRDGYITGGKTLNVITNGTNIVSGAGADLNTFLTFAASGMRIKSLAGSGFPAGDVYITRCLGQNQFETNVVIPAGTTQIRILADTPGITTTCNGTTNVVVSSSADIFVGQTMLGHTVPMSPLTKVTAIVDATNITVSQNVPATCQRADFGYTDGEWWRTKVHDDLIANNYFSGRLVNGNYAPYTAFGVEPLATIAMNGLSFDPPSVVATQIALMNYFLEEGCDVMIYCHRPALADINTRWIPFFDAIKLAVDEGRAHGGVTVPYWWRRTQRQAAIS